MATDSNKKYTLILISIISLLALFSLYIGYGNKIQIPKLVNYALTHIPLYIQEEKTSNYSTENQGQRNSELTNDSQQEQWKTILYWDRWFGAEWIVRFKDESTLESEGCPYWRCNFTYDHSALKEADAVVFSAMGLGKAKAIKRPNLHHRWVYTDVEAAPGFSYGNSLYFNWTFTYHSKSHVTAFNGYFVSLNKSLPLPVKPNLIKGNTVTFELYMNALQHNTTLKNVLGSKWLSYIRRPKLIAWMSGHCPTRSKREEYVRELQKYVSVGTYGRCGDTSCFRRNPMEPKCWVTVLKPNYLFYLSMENALCQDYITEKLYNPLLYHLVPVVYGGSSGDNYDQVLPPHSFINARKYHPKDLAKLLIHLKDNPEEYGRYHIWRGYWEPRLMGSMCQFCTRLHTNDSVHYYKYPDEIKHWRIANGKCIEVPKNMFQNKIWETKVFVNKT